MSALSSDFYPPSNRRRCVKGRPSYVEPSDNILFSQVVSQDFNGCSDSCNLMEYGTLAESEDVEEEPITIDLSAFLNENPLLAQSAFETSAENNAAPTESSSQFRVTDCEVKTTENNKNAVTDESFPISNLDNTEVKNVTAENAGEFSCTIAPTLESQGKDRSNSEEPFINVTDLEVEKPSTAVKTILAENTSKTFTPENAFLNSISIPSRDIPLNGKISPIKKFAKAKPLGLSNPLKKYKNFFKSKDLNKTNERVFGKYPVVKCEKLDIENFMKNNKIKISNWPLSQAESPKISNSLCKNITGKRLGLAKGPLKPKLSGAAKQKLLRKPISFDQYLNNSNNGIGNILNSLERTTKPIIIRTDSWKPEITNSANVPTYFKNLIKPPPVSPKTVLGDLLKLNLLNDQTVNSEPYSLPEKKIVEIKVPTVKRHCKSSTNYPRIAPKLAVLSPDVLDVVSNNSKSTVETLSDAVPNEYTVIEPYVDDPSSPQKPKPILTVPIELISSPEKHNIIVHSSSIPPNIESPAKSGKSVFLNGAFKQISMPSRVKKASPTGKSVSSNKRSVAKKKVSQKQIDVEAAPKVSFAEESEENSDILKAKNAVVDAMQIAIDLNIKKTKPRTVSKEPSNLTPISSSVGTLKTSPSSYSSILNDFTSPLGSSSYNSILNDFIVSGFSDFDDPSNSIEDESLSQISPEPPLKVCETMKNSKGEKINIKLIKSSNNSAHTSDTLTASECEDEKDHACSNGKSSLKRKLLSSQGKTSTKKCKISPKKMDSSAPASVDNSNLGGNKDFVSDHVSPSHSFSHSNCADVSVSHSVSKDNTNIPSNCDKQPETNENFVPSFSVDEDDLKQETCTRTLRERKCSSTEVDMNAENTSKQTQSRHSLENDKSVKNTLNSKLKIQKKTPPRSTAKVKIKRKSCKKEDIIQEIKQITAGAANGKKRLKKFKQSDSKNNGENSNISVINSKDDSESNSTSTLIQWKCRTAHSFSKKKRTLKVRIKRSKKRTCLKMPLSSLNDNAKNKSSVSENNSSLTSSFREEKMGTPCKEESSPQNKASLSECSMETDEKKTPDEYLPADIPDDSVVKFDSTAADSVLEVNLLDQPNISFNEELTAEIKTLNKSDEERKCDEILSENSSHLDDESKEVNECTFTEVELKNNISDQNNNQELGLALTQIVDAVINSEIEEDCHKNNLTKTNNENIAEVSLDSICEQVSCTNVTYVSSGENVSGVVVNNVTESVDSSEKANCKVNTADNVNKSLREIENLDFEKDKMEFVDLSENDSKKEELESLQENMLNTRSGLDDLTDANMSSTEEGKTGVQSPCHRPSDLEQNSPDKDSAIPKKCPKIKIVMKNTVKLHDSSKNWFVSESQESEASAETFSNVEDLKTSTSESFSEVKRLYAVENLKTSTSESCKKVKSLSNVEDLKTSSSESFSEVKSLSNVEDLKTSSSESFSEVKSLSNVKDLETSASESFSEVKSLSNVEDLKTSASESFSEVKSLSNVKDLETSASESFSEVKSLSNVEDLESSASESFSEVKSLSNVEDLGTSASESDSRIKHEVKSVADVSSVYDATNNCGTSENSIAEKGKLVYDYVPGGKADDLLLNHVTREMSGDITAEQTNCVSSNIVSDFSTERENSFTEDSVSNSNDISNQVENASSSDVGKLSNELNDASLIDVSVLTDVKDAACVEESARVEDTKKEYLGSPSESLQPKKRGRRPKKTHHELDVSAISTTVVKDEVPGKEKSSSNTFTPMKGRKKKLGISLVKQEEEESLLSSTPLSCKRKKARSASLPNHNDQPNVKDKMLTSTPSSGRKKNYDLELVRLPFNKGWMREHVIRATAKDISKPASDIYYFSPEGTKLRSMPEIGSYLAKHPEIDLNLKNFTFAKELIFREPFEIERDARQTLKKVIPDKKNVTPITEVSPKKSKKSLHKRKPGKTPTADGSAVSDSVRETVIKRENSPSSQIVNISSDSLNGSKYFRKSKQKTIDQCWNAGIITCEQKTRSSRKIVKKVPFDNSIDDKCSKRLQSSELRKVKIKVEPEDCEDTSVNNNNLTTKTTTAVVNNNNCKSNSLIVHFPKVNTKEHSGQQVIDSSPFTVTKSNELIINKVSDKRTNIKSPHIQSRLKVKLAHKKYEPHLLQKPCTRFCNLLRAVEPSVQCAICLCLFHPDCIPCRPVVNFRQYACVPCVKNQEKNPSDDDFPEFPPEYDSEMMYPKMSLQIDMNPAFDRIYNKFYSPVDPSFVNSCEGTSRQPMQICEVKSVPQSTTSKCYIIEKEALNNLYKVANTYPSPSANRTGVTLPPNFRVISAVTIPGSLNAFPNSYGRLPLPRFQNPNYLTDRSFFQMPVTFRNTVNKTANSMPQPCVVPILPKPRAESPVVSSKENACNSVLQSLLLMPGQSSSMCPLNVNASSSSRTYSKKLDQASPLVSDTNMSVVSEKRTIDSSGDHQNTKKRKLSTDSMKKNSEHFSSVWDIKKFSQIYECLNLIFKFLNVCDLLRASLVCRSWKHLASQKLLWDSVSFSGMTVKDWNQCCRTLQKNKTKRIDFRGICDQEDKWESFSHCVYMLSDIEELIFEKVPPFVMVRIADCLPHLKRLTCYCLTSVFEEPDIWSTPCEFELSTLRCLGRLEALKISSMGGILLKEGEPSLMPYLPNLTHVVLTGFKFNSHLNLECLSQQKELSSLELGDCADIEPQIYGLLAKLINLEHLCLQNGGDVHDSKLPEALSKMSRLKNLELMNFKISNRLSSILEKMSSLQSFSLWPDSTQDGAQVNYNAYVAATSCGGSLRSLCWGILVDDDDERSVPSSLELKDAGSEMERVTFEELFQTLVRRYPGGKVEVKCLPKSIWSEFCSSRNFL